jgi:hypothetical protein
MAKVGIPVLVKHCALAIYKSKYAQGSKIQQIQQSFDIARSRLVEYGFLKKGSETGSPEDIKLTGKGHHRESKHRREVGGKKKTKAWDDLYALIQEEVEEEPGDESADEEVSPFGGNKRAIRAQQKKKRLAKAARSAPKPKPRTKRRTVKKAKKARRR